MARVTQARVEYDREQNPSAQIKDLSGSLEAQLQQYADVINRNANSTDYVTELPTAGADLVGRMAVLEDAGGAGVSEAYICMETSSGTYTWVPFAQIGTEDLRFPATSVGPGATTPTAVSASPWGGTWDFKSPSGPVESIVFVVQIPHGWQDAEITPHIHWTKTVAAAGNVSWSLDYQLADPGELFPNSATTVGPVSTPVAGTPDDDSQWRHLISSFGALAAPDPLPTEKSCIFICELSRVASGDTYGSSARLLTSDFHYLRWRHGSLTPF